MHVQFVQDLICPWCRIGKANFDRAAETFEKEQGEPVSVEWVPFLLDPVEKGSAENFLERLSTRKGMEPEQVRGMFANVEEAGRKVGLTFNFDRIEVAVDTIPSHQMIALIPEEHQSGVIDRIHTAYFEDGKNIGDTTVLDSIGRDAGVPGEAMERVRQAWDSNQVRHEILNLVQQVQSAGVNGVPFFIFDSKLAANGAQPPEILVDAMKHAQTMPAEVPAD